ncbi:MAG TPA: YtxH domain-containing protein [Candidatus Krumholzibacteria bacterium]|nr:YtxH domain-containing protein [Candidatus Krumholzibacteria bacterium]
MENEHRRGSTALAFLIGAVAGGVTALLLTPRTGKEVRRSLRRGAHDMREKGEQLAHEMGERAGSVTGAVKGAASAARTTYRDELEKRGVTPATEPKLHGEPETVGSKARSGATS